MCRRTALSAVACQPLRGGQGLVGGRREHVLLRVRLSVEVIHLLHMLEHCADELPLARELHSHSERRSISRRVAQVTGTYVPPSPAACYDIHLLHMLEHCADELPLA